MASRVDWPGETLLVTAGRSWRFLTGSCGPHNRENKITHSECILNQILVDSQRLQETFLCPSLFLSCVLKHCCLALCQREAPEGVYLVEERKNDTHQRTPSCLLPEQTSFKSQVFAGNSIGKCWSPLYRKVELPDSSDFENEFSSDPAVWDR